MPCFHYLHLVLFLAFMFLPKMMLDCYNILTHILSCLLVSSHVYFESSFATGKKREKPDFVLLHVLCLYFPRGILKTFSTCTRSTCLSSLFHWPMCPCLYQYCTVWVTLAFHYILKVSGTLSHHNGVTVSNGNVLHIFKGQRRVWGDEQ